MTGDAGRGRWSTQTARRPWMALWIEDEAVSAERGVTNQTPNPPTKIDIVRHRPASSSPVHTGRLFRCARGWP